MFQKLSYLVSINSVITLPQTVRLFYVSLRSQSPQQQYTVRVLVCVHVHVPAMFLIVCTIPHLGLFDDD